MRATLLAMSVLAGLAAPATASGPAPTPLTECVTPPLVNAPAGEPTGCATLSGPSTISGSYAARQLTLTLARGSATATLTCAGDPAVSVTVTAGKPGTVSGYVIGYGNCWVTLTALAADTTAVASNTTTYVFP